MIEIAVRDHMDRFNPNLGLHIRPARDFLYEDNKWVTQVQTAITRCVGFNNLEDSVVIVGHEKDESTFYLRWFPSYDFLDSGKFIEVGEHPIDATQIRQLMFENKITFVRSVMPRVVFDWILENRYDTGEWKRIVEEYQFIRKYQEQWKDSPYPVTLNTVDAVVLQGGHVLLIRRKAAPGKGLWALPGGYIDPNETGRVSCLRELREETKLKVPPKVLDANITHSQVFDHPNRSLRGRTITQAFLIELPGPDDGKLPVVKGADDAAEAKWFPISTALDMPELIFEDHHSIISMLTARAK
jgi:bifunctional NMN adenylyltransferase/nudix hydrolase